MSTSACTVKPAISIQPKTVKVNGVTVSRDAIARETQNHPAPRPIDAWKAAARALAIRELLLQEANRLSVKPEPMMDEEGRCETDDESRIRILVELEAPRPVASEDDCMRYYQQNAARFRSSDLYEVAHILVSKSSGSGAFDETRNLALRLLEHLLGSPQDFEQVAKDYSSCPSRMQGGNLGQIGPGQTVSEFEIALAAMTPGAIHDGLVESRYGFHIVRLDRKIAGAQLPFGLVKDNIRDFLNDRVERTALTQYIRILAGRAQLEGIDLDTSTSPLVQ